MFHVFTKRLQPQKKREFRFHAPAPHKLAVHHGFFFNWTRFLSLGVGIIPWRLTERFYLWGKRLVRYPRQRSRFWVNLQCRLIRTRKPRNLRMGKGKGSYKGRRTRFSPGTTLLAFSAIRSGHVRRLLRQFQVRCWFDVAASVAGRQRSHWLRARRARRRYARLAQARGWNKTRRFRQHRIFEFIQLAFTWYRVCPALAPRALRPRALSSLAWFRYQSASLHSPKTVLPVRWLWTGPLSRSFVRAVVSL